MYDEGIQPKHKTFPRFSTVSFRISFWNLNKELGGKKKARGFEGPTTVFAGWRYGPIFNGGMRDKPLFFGGKRDEKNQRDARWIDFHVRNAGYLIILSRDT